MFFWGIISFIQAVFLPGYLVNLCLNKKNSHVINVFYVTSTIFVISIALNYVLVTVLTTFHAYTRTTMMIILGIELLTLVYLKIFKKKSIQLNNSAYLLELADLIKTNKVKNIFLFVSLVSLSIGLFFFSSKIVFQSLNTFVDWDTVCSWNRWANDFYFNRLPTFTFNYPQLLPSIISIPYVIIGSNVFQFFSFWICNSFYLISIVALVSVISEKNFFIPLFLSLGIFHFTFNIKGSVGYADFPVISLVIISLCCLLNMRNDRDNKELHLFFAFISALSAAVTKQAGVFWLIVFPIVVICAENYYSNKLKITKISTRLVLLFFLVALIVVLPWYIYERYMIFIGQNHSEIFHVTQDIHQGASYLQRNILAFIKNPLYVFYPIMGLFGIWKGLQFKSMGLFGLIYFFTWSTFLSYDMRNCSVAVPLCCFVFGSTLDNVLNSQNKNQSTLKSAKGYKVLEILSSLENRELSIKRITTSLFFVGITMTLIGSIVLENLPRYSKFVDKLSAYQDKQKISKMGSLLLNSAIIYNEHKSPLKIVTRNYYVVQYLPNIAEEQIIFSGGNSLSDDVNRILDKEKEIYFIDKQDDAYLFEINFNEIKYKDLKLLVDDEQGGGKMYYISR